MCYTKVFYFQHCTHQSHTIPISECLYGWEASEKACRNRANIVRDTQAIGNPLFCTECLEFRVAILETTFEQEKKDMIEMAKREGWEKAVIYRSLRDWARQKEEAFTKFERSLGAAGAAAQNETDEQVQLDREADTDWRLQGPDHDIYRRDDIARGETALTSQEEMARAEEDANFYHGVIDPQHEVRDLMVRMDRMVHPRQALARWMDVDDAFGFSLMTQEQLLLAL